MAHTGICAANADAEVWAEVGREESREEVEEDREMTGNEIELARVVGGN